MVVNKFNMQHHKAVEVPKQTHSECAFADNHGDLFYIDLSLCIYAENELDWFSKRLEPFDHPKIDLAMVAKAGLYLCVLIIASFQSLGAFLRPIIC